MSVKVTTARIVQAAARHLGFELVRISPAAHEGARRAALLKNQRIDVVLDIGANSGQYARSLRQLGYGGRLVSIEPMGIAFERLERVAASDPLWSVINVAIGEATGTALLNVSANSVSSSLLEPTADVLRVEPAVATVSQESVNVVRLDGIIRDHVRPGERAFLKIDAQGSEKSVLLSGFDEFHRIQGVQTELALLPSYQGQPDWHEMLTLIEGKGFSLFSIEPGFADPRTGRLREFDGIFFRAVADG